MGLNVKSEKMRLPKIHGHTCETVACMTSFNPRDSRANVAAADADDVVYSRGRERCVSPDNTGIPFLCDVNAHACLGRIKWQNRLHKHVFVITLLKVQIYVNVNIIGPISRSHVWLVCDLDIKIKF